MLRQTIIEARKQETMKKEIRRVDTARNIVQITTTGERWYSRVETDLNTGLDQINYRPSTTWIVGFYPKGKGYETWLKNITGSDSGHYRSGSG